MKKEFDPASDGMMGCSRAIEWDLQEDMKTVCGTVRSDANVPWGRDRLACRKAQPTKVDNADR